MLSYYILLFLRFECVGQIISFIYETKQSHSFREYLSSKSVYTKIKHAINRIKLTKNIILYFNFVSCDKLPRNRPLTLSCRLDGSAFFFRRQLVTSNNTQKGGSSEETAVMVTHLKTCFYTNFI